MLKNNIRQIRKECGCSQQKLAKMTGIPQTTISGWEQNIGEPPVSKAFILAKALQTSIENLFPGINEISITV